MQKELFQPQLYLNPKWYIFKETELGKIYQSIPWDRLGECLPVKIKGAGAQRWFSNEGMFALMFLKSYLGLSDEKLIERFNTDYSLQIFCGKLLNINEIIKDKGIVSRIREYIADHADWQEVQWVLIDHWKRDMSNCHVLLMDASCYESYIRFPTDVKLLWESCQYVYEKQLFKLCKLIGTPRPRSKYNEQKQKQRAYDRTRKKTYQAGRKRKKALLHLLEKGLGQFQLLLNSHPHIQLKTDQYSYLATIRKVLTQQQFLQTHPAKELKNRIVSLHKPYIRPIVRGKENKRVEFGMKVHMLQVDGICLIDQMSFKAFNESTRLKMSVLKHKSIFGACHQLGADNIYATNSNRNYLTNKQIFTCFPKKGPKKHAPAEEKLRSLLATQRATVMEGSFGSQKTSYGLNKIKARKEKTEMVWVFFGVMTANAVRISRRRSESPPLQQAA
ncbi:MAG TPA: DDE transposase [Cytophagales bacterium]|nr:DDE transposase [Cytophagales bacterium]